MFKVILDCDLMRYRDSGLYHYCLNLGTYVQSLLENEHGGRISFYVPSAEKKSFGRDASCITEKKWHPKCFLQAIKGSKYYLPSMISIACMKGSRKKNRKTVYARPRNYWTAAMPLFAFLIIAKKM